MFVIEKRIENGDWVVCKHQEYNQLPNALKRARSLSKTYGLTRIMKGTEVIANFNNGRKVNS